MPSVTYRPIGLGVRAMCRLMMSCYLRVSPPEGGWVVVGCRIRDAERRHLQLQGTDGRERMDK